jgi:hypothetical protein
MSFLEKSIASVKRNAKHAANSVTDQTEKARNTLNTTKQKIETAAKRGKAILKTPEGRKAALGAAGVVAGAAVSTIGAIKLDGLKHGVAVGVGIAASLGGAELVRRHRNIKKILEIAEAKKFISEVVANLTRYIQLNNDFPQEDLWFVYPVRYLAYRVRQAGYIPPTDEKLLERQMYALARKYAVALQVWDGKDETLDSIAKTALETVAQQWAIDHAAEKADLPNSEPTITLSPKLILPHPEEMQTFCKKLLSPGFKWDTTKPLNFYEVVLYKAYQQGFRLPEDETRAFLCLQQIIFYAIQRCQRFAKTGDMRTIPADAVVKATESLRRLGEEIATGKFEPIENVMQTEDISSLLM